MAKSNVSIKGSESLILAVGGNALIREGEEGDIPQQYKHTRETFAPIVPLMDEFERVLVVHGNGPQVGNELLRNEVASFSVVPLPLDTCVANSQGSMGYMIQQVLENQLRKHGLEKPVVTVVTQTLVDPEDVAFHEPTKPIGVFYKQSEAERHTRLHGWKLQPDAGRGFRRVVPSPKPIDIIEMHSIKVLCQKGSVVIAGGGGGIPVVRGSDKRLSGVEAVVDKDYVTAIFAKLKPDVLVMLTAVEQVYLAHNTDHQKPIGEIKLVELKEHFKRGEFGVGSMGPKITCAVDYLKSKKDGKVLITSPERLADALAGKTGTWIFAQ